MASEPDGESSPKNLSQDSVRGVQKLASKLQKAVIKGRASPSTLGEADGYIGGVLTTQVGRILQWLDNITAKTAKLETKEKLGKFYLTLMGSFKSLKAMENSTYSNLSHKGVVDTEALAALIEIDSELMGTLFRMSAFLSKRRVGTVTDGDLTALDEMTELLQDNVKARETTAKKNKKTEGKSASIA